MRDFIKQKPVILTSLLLGVILIAIITTFIYSTFASDVSFSKEDTPTDADYSYNFNLFNNISKTVTVKAKSKKIVDLNITNNNSATVKYGVAYSNSNSDSDNWCWYSIGKYDKSPNDISGNIDANETKTVSIFIANGNNEDTTITLEVLTGFENGGNLIIPGDKTEIDNTTTYNSESKIPSSSLICPSRVGEVEKPVG